MERKKLSEAKATFSAVVDSVEERGEPVIIERHGKPVAALVSMEDLERLEALRGAEPPTAPNPYGLLAFLGGWGHRTDEEIDEIMDEINAMRAEPPREIDFGWGDDEIDGEAGNVSS